jgi:hypothetical protein
MDGLGRGVPSSGPGADSNRSPAPAGVLPVIPGGLVEAVEQRCRAPQASKPSCTGRCWFPGRAGRPQDGARLGRCGDQLGTHQDRPPRSPYGLLLQDELWFGERGSKRLSFTEPGVRLGCAILPESNTLDAGPAAGPATLVGKRE